MIAACCLALVPQSFLQSAVERANAGDFAGAWSVAREAPDVLERAQARVYVRQHAGDLAGSLKEALDGCAAAPKDPWLAERALAIAVSLSRARPAEEALTRLDSLLQDPNVPNREAYLAAAARARTEVQSLARATRERDAAESRARFVVIALGAASLCLLLALGRKA